MIERKILIGLIVSTEYCQRIKDIWNIQLLESSTAKRLAGWVWEYFEKYGKAPNKDIEGIYYSKLKTGKLPKDIAEEIEKEILPGLSEEYEKETFNLDYLVEESNKYFNERHIQLLTSTIQDLLGSGQIEDAEKLVREFKPLGTNTDTLNDYILTSSQIRKKKRPHPIVLMKPWLKEGQLTIIYGTFGSGKTLLTLSIAYVLGLKDYTQEESEIGEWQVRNQTGCLYIDGEMGEVEMEDRIKQFEWLGEQAPGYKTKILSVPDYQMETEDMFYLSTRVNQKKIITWLTEHPTYKLVVLDSAGTLFGLEEENSNSEWNLKIQPFLRDLRALGVACILLHHAGKDGKKGLRGASAMGAMAHCIFRLTNHPDKSNEEGEAWFTLTIDKQRAAGFSFRKFSLHYIRNVDKTETNWEIT